MITRKTILMKLLIGFLLFPCAAWAQISVSLSAGYGSWAMKSMKEWQEEYRNSFPVEGKTLGSFPPYLYYDASIVQQSDQWIRGLAVSNGSTGGRIYYSDYSGKTSMDQSLSFYALSGIIGRTLNRNTEKLLITGSMRPGVTISKMSYDYEQVIYDAGSENISNKFSSYSLTIQPAVSLIRKFGRIGVEVLAGYHLIVVGGKLVYDDESGIPSNQGNVDYLIKNDKGPVTSNWSGYRLSLGISVQLN